MIVLHILKELERKMFNSGFTKFEKKGKIKLLMQTHFRNMDTHTVRAPHNLGHITTMVHEWFLLTYHSCYTHVHRNMIVVDSIWRAKPAMVSLNTVVSFGWRGYKNSFDKVVPNKVSHL